MNSQRKPTTWQNPRQALSIFTMWACNRYRKNRILNPCTVYLSCVFVLLILKRSFQQRKNCISAVRALQSSGCGFWTSSNISYMFASLSDRLPRCCRRRPATSRSPWGKTWSSSGTCQQSSCGPSPPTCFLLTLSCCVGSNWHSDTVQWNGISEPSYLLINNSIHDTSNSHNAAVQFYFYHFHCGIGK